jgi:hypothetical protein
MAKTTSPGTTLKMDNGVSYDTIGNTVSIGAPSGTLNMIDATHLNSPSNFREYLPGYLDGGECRMTCHLDPEAADASNQLLVKTKHTTRAEATFRIVLPTGPYVQFDAYVTAWEPFQIPEEGVVGLEFGLKITGALTYGDAEP